jgi:transposase
MGPDSATALLGLPGLRVIDVEATADATTVHVRTEPGVGAACPDCHTPAKRCKEEVVTSPRDLPCGGQAVLLVWHKRRWYCQHPDCKRKTFTESLPGLPPRCRLTTRMRAHLGAAVADSGRTVAEVSATNQVAWHTSHRAFVARVDPQLSAEPGPVTHLGIDEIRRGAPRWGVHPDTGETTQLADRWPSRTGARCWPCSQSVSPARLPHPACDSHRTGRSTCLTRRSTAGRGCRVGGPW